MITAQVRWTGMKGRCACCSACTRKGRTSAITFWSIRQAASWANVLELDAQLERNCHALITNPGATRFYRSAGDTSTQSVQATLAEGARLEWLPMESIAYSACQAHNSLRFNLAPGAEMIGWDLLALGLPAAGHPYERGQFIQELDIPGAWLERGRIDATDTRLLNSPLGWAGRRVLATMWFAAGSAIASDRRDALLDAARSCVANHGELSTHAGATAPHDTVVVLRALAHRVEPAMQLFKQVWAAWRGVAWHLDATPPRLWRT